MVLPYCVVVFCTFYCRKLHLFLLQIAPFLPFVKGAILQVYLELVLVSAAGVYDDGNHLVALQFIDGILRVADRLARFCRQRLDPRPSRPSSPAWVRSLTDFTVSAEACPATLSPFFTFGESSI